MSEHHLKNKQKNKPREPERENMLQHLHKEALLWEHAPAISISISFLWVTVTGKKVGHFCRLPFSITLFIAWYIRTKQIFGEWSNNSEKLNISSKQLWSTRRHFLWFRKWYTYYFFSLKDKRLCNFSCQLYSIYSDYSSLLW